MPKTVSELRLRLQQRIVLILARSTTPVTYASLRRQSEHYVRALYMKDLDFRKFLLKLEEHQVIIESAERGILHYELFNKSDSVTRTIIEDKKKTNDVILAERYPELIANARLLKLQREKKLASTPNIQYHYQQEEKPEAEDSSSKGTYVPKLYDGTKVRVKLNDPDGFGEKTGPKFDPNAL